jgi:opacity protein-like surface antigen
MKIMMKKLGTILLAVALTSFACAKDITSKVAHVQSGSGKEGNQQSGINAGDGWSNQYFRQEVQRAVF